MPAVAYRGFDEVLVSAARGTGGTGAAVDRALLLPLARGAVVRVVHLLPPRGMSPREEAERRRALPAEEERPHRASPWAIRVRPELAAGEPARALVEAARAGRAQMIVVPEEPEGPAQTAAVAVRVARGAHVPVLVARVPPAPYRRALAAVALAGDEEAVLSLAARLLDGTRARLEVLHAWRSPFENLVDRQSSREEIARYRTAENEHARRTLDAAIRHWVPKPRVATERLRYGRAAAVISAEAGRRRADLVVVGTDASPPLVQRLGGSVPATVLEAVACDVLLAPAAAAG